VLELGYGMCIRKLQELRRNKNKMITCIGSVFDTSGYSIHFRNLANALAKHTEVSIETNLPENWQAQVNDSELEMIKRESDGEINLIITNPINWRVFCNAKRNWVFGVFEGDKIQKHFLKEMLNKSIEYVFTPSEHCVSAILKTIESLSEKECKKILGEEYDN